MELRRISMVQRNKLFGEYIQPLVNTRVPKKAMMKQCRKFVSNYLYENDDFCFCTACNSYIDFSGKFDKHKSERKCPRCHKPVTVLRKCCSKDIREVSYIAYPHFLDNGIVMRYFEYGIAYVMKDNKVSIFEKFNEVAAELVMQDVLVRAEIDCFGNWYVTTNGESGFYFRLFNNSCYWYGDNPHCARYARMFKPMLYTFLDYVGEKLNSHYDISDYEGMFDVEDFLLNTIYLNGELYEKLSKIGLIGLYSCVPNKKAKGSVCRNLYVNKEELRFLIAHSNERIYCIYQFTRYCHTHNISPKIRNIIYDYLKSYCSYLEYVEMLSSNTVKKISYLTKNKIKVYEYKSYIGLAKKLNIEMNNSVLYPKDFQKAYSRLQEQEELIRFEEQREQRERELAQQLADNKKYNSVIGEIYTAMSNSKDIQSFMSKSKGLIVKIPESVEELVQEGARLHNCLGTYPKRVAEGKTMVFFIRKVEEPDTAYYAFEYCNGEIVQCRTFNNYNGEDYEVVISFAEAFVKALKKYEKKQKLIQSVA